MATRNVRKGAPVTVLTSAARTASPTVDTFRVGGGPAQGLVLVVDCTAVAATPSVVFTILGSDPISAKTWSILASAAITGTGTTILKVHPELAASANAVAKDLVPNAFTVTAVHADGDSITYSVSAHLI